ncbi:uncharacterized protein PHALS_00681 [Plasmopara halstedii]|uniref:Uncharacterized protein n=1 Tax=Plasmopara halstedii TaxID=4781 RepID=A0A0P1ARS8_PLAHL|nr:uncharacterized protein PHALS_00681 [Plasmopara halstedii]CEG44312.1 hypothetical protein PHALS_00681 [Plasmopara halstedii]|eukprot:XP_024580681.1 hypothetical protein PHALS_00681 [Plasmopara halstedii]
MCVALLFRPEELRMPHRDTMYVSLTIWSLRGFSLQSNRRSHRVVASHTGALSIVV